MDRVTTPASEKFRLSRSGGSFGKLTGTKKRSSIALARRQAGTFRRDIPGVVPVTRGSVMEKLSQMPRRGIPIDRRLPLVATVLAGVWLLAPSFADGDNPTRTLASQEEYTRFASTHRGDAERGRALFADAKRLVCVRCHRVRGQGGDVGPDLSDIGGKFDRPLLIESMLDPSRQIVEGYRTTTIGTTDGRIVTGIARDESAAGLVVVDADGKRHAVRADEIEDRKTVNTSLMPSSLAAGLSPAEFTDLIAYLETLRSSGPIALPQGFTWSRVAAGITGATAMEVAADGRVFVCEQTGALRIVKGDRLLDAPFLTVRVDSTWERGLIGVALDPAFAKNGHVYVTYVAPQPYPHHRVSRFTARGDVAVANSETILFEGDDQTKLGGEVPAGHQGGAIHFGIDGKLYVALGEQTARTPAQAMDMLLGKLLRINSDGTIPEDNPFFRKARGKYRAIWAARAAQPFHLRRAARDRPDLLERRGTDHLGRDRRGFRRQ